MRKIDSMFILLIMSHILLATSFELQKPTGETWTVVKKNF